MKWLICSAFVFGVFLFHPANKADAFFGKRRVVYAPVPSQKLMLEVVHPLTCCKYKIAVCIPACCCGAPAVHFQRTIIGHGKVVFRWSCGHEVVVRFPPRGGIRVIQRG